jgi:Holliday junction resolvasome RuvABC DNA-binding subunit
MSVSTIAHWIEAGDTASLSKLPGVGKRTAETIVAQLRRQGDRGSAPGRAGYDLKGKAGGGAGRE